MGTVVVVIGQSIEIPSPNILNDQTAFLVDSMLLFLNKGIQNFTRQ